MFFIIPYFPVERAFCYGSDLLMRQYDALKESLGQDFTYQKMNPVYVIVLIEESTREFHAIPEQYIHRSQLSFDTQLELKNLIRFIFIPLDIFRKSSIMKTERRNIILPGFKRSQGLMPGSASSPQTIRRTWRESFRLTLFSVISTKIS